MFEYGKLNLSTLENILKEFVFNKNKHLKENIAELCLNFIHSVDTKNKNINLKEIFVNCLEYFNILSKDAYPNVRKLSKNCLEIIYKKKDENNNK